MSLVKVIRKGVTPSVRKVMKVRTLAVMPLTFDRVNQEAASDLEEPVKVDSVQDAFDHFQPRLSFEGRTGEAEFPAELHFRSMKDFDPEQLQRRKEIHNPTGEAENLPN